MQAATVTGRAERFDCLVENAQACLLCPAMDGRRRVLSRANGSLTPQVLFVAEAPGRRGGERTGIPLTTITPPLPRMQVIGMTYVRPPSSNRRRAVIGV